MISKLFLLLVFFLLLQLSMSLLFSFHPRVTRAVISPMSRLFSAEKVIIVKENKLQDIENAPGKKVFYFTADWCSPCRLIAPIFEKISLENQDTMFVKIDIDNNDELAVKYGIHGIPTFMFLKGTNVVSKVYFLVVHLFTCIIELILLCIFSLSVFWS